MSEENEKQRLTKFCVYCGTTIEENTAYCPNPKCGKLVIKIKASEPSTEKQMVPSKLEKKRKSISMWIQEWEEWEFPSVKLFLISNPPLY